MLLLQFVALMGLCSPIQSFYFINYTGSLNSNHSLFYVGENAVLDCKKNSALEAKVIFKRGNEFVDQRYVTSLSDRQARYEKPVTPQDFAEINYICRESNSSRLIGCKTIYSDYAPQNATYFEMIWLAEKKLIMKWKHGVGNITYFNIHTDKVIQISAEWRKVRNDSDGNWQECDAATNISCIVNFIRNRDDIISVRVNITNVKRADKVTTVFPGWRVADHVKPKPADLRSISSRSSRSVIINVKNEWPTLVRRVTYCSVGTQNDKCSEVDILPINQTKQAADISHSMVVSGLHPSFTYSMRVQDRFDYGGYFSDPSNAFNVTLPEDVPTAGPTVSPGSYYWDRTQCSPTSPSATLYIYFQDVPEKHQNGPLMHFSGVVRSAGKVQSVNTLSSGPRTLKIENLDCEKNVNISLYASNKMGPSPASELSLNAWDKDLFHKVNGLDMRLKVEEEENVTAEWNLDPDSVFNLNGYTFLLYYCTRKTLGSDKCEDTIKSVRLNSTRGSASVPSEGHFAPKNMVGLAAVTPQGLTVGIVKSTCIYNPKKRGGRVAGVQAVPQGSSLIVSWLGERCDPDTEVRILEYQVEVCPVSDKSPCRRQVVSGDKNSWVMTDVNPGRYSAKVRALTAAGLTEFSEQKVVDVPSETGLTTSQIIGIIMGSLLFCILLGSVVFCWCRKKTLEKDFSRNIERSSFQKNVIHRGMDLMNGADNVGADISSDNNNTDDSGKGPPPLIKQQISDDSGCDPSSPPVSPSTVGPGPITVSGTPVQRSPPTPITITPLNSAMLEANTFTNPRMTSNDFPSQETKDADSSLQREDGTVPPYVSAAFVSPAHDDASGTGLDEWPPPSGVGAGGQMVYFVTGDPLVMCYGNDSSLTSSSLSPTKGGLSVGTPDWKNGTQKGVRVAEKKGVRVAQEKGITAAKDVHIAQKENSFPKPEAEPTDDASVDPSAFEVTEKKAITHPASGKISSYVTLSPACSGDQGVPGQGMTDHRFTSGEEEEEEEDSDASVDDEGKVIFSASASGRVQDGVGQQISVGGSSLEDFAEGPQLLEEAGSIKKHTSEDLAGKPQLHEEADTTSKTAFEDFEEKPQQEAETTTKPTSEDFAENPHPLEKAESRINPAYVQFPMKLQSGCVNPDTTDEEGQDLTCLMAEPHPPDPGRAGLHPGYVPHALHAQPVVHDQEKEEEEFEFDKKWEGSSSASSHDRGDPRQVAADPVSSLSDGYVTLPSLASTASPSVDTRHSSPTFGSETEDSDADDSCIHLDFSGNGEGHTTATKGEGHTSSTKGEGHTTSTRGQGHTTSTKGEGHTTSTKGTLDKNGYVHLGKDPDGSGVFISGKGLGNSSHKNLTENTSPGEGRTGQVKANSNGLLAGVSPDSSGLVGLLAGVSPNSSGLVGLLAGVSPNSSGLVGLLAGVSPNSSGLVGLLAGVSPDSSGLVGLLAGVSPDSSGLVGLLAGVSPNSSGLVGLLAGVSPDSSGLVGLLAGVSPDSSGLVGRDCNQSGKTSNALPTGNQHLFEGTSIFPFTADHLPSLSNYEL
ncbi:hypothetical protein ACOMHN_017701 [Nucella lapillus]